MELFDLYVVAASTDKAEISLVKIRRCCEFGAWNMSQWVEIEVVDPSRGEPAGEA